MYFRNDNDPSTSSTPARPPQLPPWRETLTPRHSTESVQKPTLSISRSRSPHRTTHEQHWKTENNPDVAPILPRFAPTRPPGVQLDKSKVYSPLDLFQLFFRNNVIRKLCSNTNKQAAKRISEGLQFKWTDVTPTDFLKYLALVIFMGLLKLGSVKAYWRQKKTFFSAISKESDAKGQVALHFLKCAHERSG